MSKTKDIVTNWQLTGICDIDVNQVIKQWNERWYVSQWKDEYTLIKRRKRSSICPIKVQISFQSFEKLKNNLLLIETKSEVFRSASSWRKEGHYDGM